MRSSIVKLMHPHSAIATPLLAAQGSLGVIVLGRSAGRARFTETDVQMVEELGRRLAVGLANTDAFAREHAIAETLQRSLLPDTLPQIPGLDIAVRYLPATEGADVGGDWYDAFPLKDGLVGLVTGDVAGHNIASASIMGQVRSLLRGYAIDDPDPARVLERTNTAVSSLLPDVLASAVYAVLDPATGDLGYANAGHPPPLVADRHRARRIPRRHGRRHAGRVPWHQLHCRPPAAPARRHGCSFTLTGSSKTGTGTSPTGSRSSPRRCGAPGPARPSRRAPPCTRRSWAATARTTTSAC